MEQTQGDLPVEQSTKIELIIISRPRRRSALKSHPRRPGHRMIPRHGGPPNLLPVADEAIEWWHCATANGTKLGRRRVKPAVAGAHTGVEGERRRYPQNRQEGRDRHQGG